jgi:hypothetical protein
MLSVPPYSGSPNLSHQCAAVGVGAGVVAVGAGVVAVGAGVVAVGAGVVAVGAGVVAVGVGVASPAQADKVTNRAISIIIRNRLSFLFIFISPSFHSGVFVSSAISSHHHPLTLFGSKHKGMATVLFCECLVSSLLPCSLISRQPAFVGFYLSINFYCITI